MKRIAKHRSLPLVIETIRTLRVTELELVAGGGIVRTNKNNATCVCGTQVTAGCP